jgi:hypothetical protein
MGRRDPNDARLEIKGAALSGCRWQGWRAGIRTPACRPLAGAPPSFVGASIRKARRSGQGHSRTSGRPSRPRLAALGSRSRVQPPARGSSETASARPTRTNQDPKQRCAWASWLLRRRRHRDDGEGASAPRWVPFVIWRRHQRPRTWSEVFNGMLVDALEMKIVPSGTPIHVPLSWYSSASQDRRRAAIQDSDPSSQSEALGPRDSELPSLTSVIRASFQSSQFRRKFINPTLPSQPSEIRGCGLIRP